MLCFEVFRNGQKICTAGVGDYGVLTAIMTWVGHHPDKLAQWAKEGATDNAPVDLFLSVGGIVGNNDEPSEHARWVEQAPLSVGDEIVIQVLEASQADSPVRCRHADPAKDLEKKKTYVRDIAKELRWQIVESDSPS